MESFPPYNEADYSKSRLNSLLLILIIALFGSGAALMILRQINTYDREQIYLATQAALPEHKISAAQTTKNEFVLKCQNLPNEISGHFVFKNWLQVYSLPADFCEGEIKPLKIENQNGYGTKAECETSIKESGGMGKYIGSPDQKKGICMGGFGEPDSYVFLTQGQNGQGKALLSCGTPCNYENGFWLDNSRFVLLASYNIDGFNLEHGVSLFNFQNQTLTYWKGEWRTYRNEEYGFEFKCPTSWKYSEANEERPSGPATAFFCSLGKSRVSILPVDGFGYGTPFEEPKVLTESFAGKKAQRIYWEQWSKDNSDYRYEIYQITEPIQNWLVCPAEDGKSCNRIDILTLVGDYPIAQEILSTFKFTPTP